MRASAVEQLLIPVKDGQPILLHVPAHLWEAKQLHGKNQVYAVAYFQYRTSIKPDWKFHPVELAEVLGMTRYGARDLLMAMARKGLVHDLGNKRIDTPARLMAYGLAYRKVHEYQANMGALNDLLYNKCQPKFAPTILKGTIVLNNRKPEPHTYNKSPLEVLQKAGIQYQSNPIVLNEPLYTQEETKQITEWCKNGRLDLWKAYTDLRSNEHDAVFQEHLEWYRTLFQEYGILPDPELEALKQALRTSRAISERAECQQKERNKTYDPRNLQPHKPSH